MLYTVDIENYGNQIGKVDMVLFNRLEVERTCLMPKQCSYNPKTWSQCKQGRLN